MRPRCVRDRPSRDDDAIVLVDELSDQLAAEDARVRFEIFVGVGARRFVDLFSLTLGSGRRVRRKVPEGECGACGGRDVTGRAPTYEEVLAAARRAAEEIEREWPAWKRALSQPRPQPKHADQERCDDPKPR